MTSTNHNMKNPAVKRIVQEIKELQRESSGDVSAEALQDNIFEWQFAIRGAPGTDFEGGIYHGRIILPPEYPFKPPSFIMQTPNGRFEVGVKLCLSISQHHPEQWQPSWSVRTALVALIAFMPTRPDGAIGGLSYTSAERRALAAKSRVSPPQTTGSEERNELIQSIHQQMLDWEAEHTASSTATSDPAAASSTPAPDAAAPDLACPETTAPPAPAAPTPAAPDTPTEPSSSLDTPGSSSSAPGASSDPSTSHTGSSAGASSSGSAEASGAAAPGGSGSPCAPGAAGVCSVPCVECREGAAAGGAAAEAEAEEVPELRRRRGAPGEADEGAASDRAAEPAGPRARNSETLAAQSDAEDALINKLIAAIVCAIIFILFRKYLIYAQYI